MNDSPMPADLPMGPDHRISGPPEMSQGICGYAHAIENLLRGNVVGIYLYGSTAAGSHLPGISDIDLMPKDKAATRMPSPPAC